AHRSASTRARGTGLYRPVAVPEHVLAGGLRLGGLVSRDGAGHDAIAGYFPCDVLIGVRPGTRRVRVLVVAVRVALEVALGAGGAARVGVVPVTAIFLRLRPRQR